MYTVACSCRSHDINGTCIDQDAGLKVLSVVVSNETIHERNIAFSCNMKLLEIVRQHIPSLKKAYFWSDGCTSQSRSRFTFRSMTYPNDLELSWDYGEAHHFKSPHDCLGGTVKRKVYQDVTASKVIIRDAKHFARYANSILEVQVEYLDKSDILPPKLDGATYIKGTLQIHHLERVGKLKVNFSYNSTYKKSSNLLRAVDYAKASTPDLEELDEPSENEKDESFTGAVDQHDALEVSIGNILVVL